MDHFSPHANLNRFMYLKIGTCDLSHALLERVAYAIPSKG